MVKVVFLASIRERLGCGEHSVEVPVSPLSVAALGEILARQGDDWKKILQHEKVLVAINQQMGRPDSMVHDGDEVAFFPPVTGG